MNILYWRNRYKMLKERGTIGQMTWNITQKTIEFQNMIRPLIDGQRFNRVIDFGCGTAKDTEFLIDVFKCKKYVGYDVVGMVIKENKLKYPFAEYKIYIDELNKTDVIWSSFTLQHFDDNELIEILEENLKGY